MVRLTPSGVDDKRGGPAGDELGDAAQRVGVAERALELGGDDRVDVAGLVAGGVADGLLARRVGPAGAVGDHVGVVRAQQAADDLAQRVELIVGGAGQGGADVVAIDGAVHDRVIAESTPGDALERHVLAVCASERARGDGSGGGAAPERMLVVARRLALAPLNRRTRATHHPPPAPRCWAAAGSLSAAVR